MPVLLDVTNVVDFCMSSASACIESGNSRQANDLMRAELGEIARQVARWEMSGENKALLFFRPMEKRLLNRYGPSIGRNLFLDFIDAFWLQSWTVFPLDPAKPGRDIESTAEWHRRILTDHRSIQLIVTIAWAAELARNN
jgi:hypothetical protein